MKRFISSYHNSYITTSRRNMNLVSLFSSYGLLSVTIFSWHWGQKRWYERRAMQNDGNRHSCLFLTQTDTPHTIFILIWRVSLIGQNKSYLSLVHVMIIIVLIDLWMVAAKLLATCKEVENFQLPCIDFSTAYKCKLWKVENTENQRYLQHPPFPVC